MYYITIFLLLVVQALCSAQEETTNWYFGDRVGLSFASGTPVLLNDGKMSTTEGCAVMSDRTTGKLLFYTDGSTIWNGNHDVVKNGTGLMGGASGTQTALIIPNPGNEKEYYIFTVPDLTTSSTPLTESMYYSLVSVANPAIDILVKNVKLLDGVSEKLTGSLDNTGKGYWVVTHHRQNNEFYSYHITSKGINTSPVISKYIAPTIDHTAGYIRISPDRLKLAIATHNASSFLALFDFNPATGELYNYRLLGKPANNDKFYGVSFSPDNSKLYAIGKTFLSRIYESALFQYEVNLPTSTEIQNSVVVFPVRIPVTFVASLQLAMDCKIYIASTFRKYLDIIHSPNEKGVLCQYQEDAIALPRQCNLGLPNFINYTSISRNFSLSPDTITFIPNDVSQIELNIPRDISEWHLRILYNPLIAQFDTIARQSPTLHITSLKVQNNGQLSLNGTGAIGTLLLNFKTYLPHTSDSIFAFQLMLDSVKSSSTCGDILSTGNTLKTGDYCGRNFRYVSGTGSTYFLSAANMQVHFGVGLAGNIRLEVFDFLGRSVQVLADTYFEPGSYSTTVELPTGLYFCRMSAGVVEKAVKMVVVR
ncbi:MAG: hypothetical protein U0264_05015 [Candidatus Kapaibacterium sp.]